MVEENTFYSINKCLDFFFLLVSDLCVNMPNILKIK